jgi:hypothetical protein
MNDRVQAKHSHLLGITANFGLGTKNSVKEYLSLFQVVAILISGFGGQFWQEFRRRQQRHLKHDNRALQPVPFEPQ